MRADYDSTANAISIAITDAAHADTSDEVHARAQVLGAQLLGAGQGHRPDPEARDHRQHPLRAVPDHGHHHVAAGHPLAHQVPPEPASQGLYLAEAEHASGAVPPDCDKRRIPLWNGLYDGVYEVHRGGRVGAEGRPGRFRAPAQEVFRVAECL